MVYIKCKKVLYSFLLILMLSVPLSAELIGGGNNDNGALNATSWTLMMDEGSVNVGNCITRRCIQVNPFIANSGMYQAIETEVGTTYKIEADLMGSNHYTDLNNYTLGSTYITVEDSLPTPTSVPTHTSQRVSSNTVTTVELTFTATSTTTYISLRGDTAFRYPTALFISMKEVGVYDTVKSINGPSSIKRGQRVTLTVDYVATQRRTLAIYLKATTGTKEEYFYTRVNAPKGDSVKQVTFTVPENTPTNLTYKYGVYIAAKGKYFKDNLGKAYQHGVKVEINTTSISDTVKSINGPSSIKRGQRVTLTVDYVATQRRTLAIYLKATTGTKEEYFYTRVNAPKGDSVKQVTFTVPENTPTNLTYKYGVYIAPKGKYFKDNLGKVYQHGVKVAIANTNKPWVHGTLKISSDNTILQHTDGTDFFWMADTAWHLYRKSKEDIDIYMHNRAEKKFTVIQAIALDSHRSSSNGEKPFIDDDISQPNEVYWEHIDYLLSKAEEHGLYVALLPTWHSAVEYGTFRTSADAGIFGEWIAARYRNRPNIIWVIGGDTPIDGSRVPSGMTAQEEISIWNALGYAINRVDSNHLMTFHPLVRIPSVELGNPSWLDFNMLQSGRSGIRHSIRHVELALRENIPVVDGESLYEDIAYGREGETARRTAFQVREDAYSQLFAGAFGNTYGHNAIYRFWEDTAPGNCSAYFCTPTKTWKEALEDDGGKQMEYVTKLMKSRPILGRLPDQSLLSGTPSSQSGIVATLGNGYAMIYSSEGENFTIVMGKVSGTEVRAWWYNPRNGVSTYIGEFDNNGTYVFNPPSAPTSNTRGANDWVLVLDDSSRGFTEPGR